ncbi:Inhibitor of apoptosis-promoting Bax1-related protein [Kickxella alabastrina]|uniref:Inhibitor of apoptosis-promoting Bax1-related protein n=1 Tax=Kickxella alabastrina TaxID=61397 RepID=A0ACC1HYF0_9FUNG|nr:Inhibitor of apoptosis-promoting Bax1-related protein [Kickxella alabastrina]
MDAHDFFDCFTRTSTLSRATQRELLLVYTTLITTLLSSIAGIYSAYHLNIYETFPLLIPITLLLLTFAMYLVPATKQNVGKRQTTLLCLGWVTGVFITPFISRMEYRTGSMDVVVGAAGLSILMFAAFALATVCFERSQVVYTMGAVWTALGSLAWVGFAGWMWGSYGYFLDLHLLVGLATACAYVVKHTNDLVDLAQGGQWLDPVSHALGFFNDFVRIFMHLAVILARNKERRDPQDKKNKKKRQGRAQAQRWAQQCY